MEKFPSVEQRPEHERFLEEVSECLDRGDLEAFSQKISRAMELMGDPSASAWYGLTRAACVAGKEKLGHAAMYQFFEDRFGDPDNHGIMADEYVGRP